MAHLNTGQSRFKCSTATCGQWLLYRTDEIYREDEPEAKKKKKNSLMITVQEKSNN